jgi:uncharacterized lipoprotein YddW (UPF0748 family)
MRKILLVFLCLFTFFPNIAVVNGRGKIKNMPIPKRELRAVWIATVNNIDWPSKAGLSSSQQQAEIRELLDYHKFCGMNTIIMQVRPCADAIYSSASEPWSRYLMGEQGVAPEPFYDPLEYFISECHKRGMEFHAWFNPYRIKQNMKDPLAPNNIFTQHPEWGWTYGDRIYLDPGNPEVRDYLSKVVSEVVIHYDIDTVHFDDYFYPYKVEGKVLPDQETFKKYSRGYSSEKIGDWRRDNVNLIIQMLSQSIKEIKPWVKFGVSPFGVWRNASADPEGSSTSAGTSDYDDLYADVLYWLRKGWIDYAMPQLYWEIGHKSADFKTLAEWWAKHSYDRAVYAGHALYKLDKASKVKAWQSSDQLISQINTVRSIPNLKGSAWFSSSQFRRDLDGFQDRLKRKQYISPSIVPEMPWIDKTIPSAPSNLTIDNAENGQTVNWDAVKGENEMQNARFYAIYRSKSKRKLNIDKPENLINVTGEQGFFLRDSGKKHKRKYYYCITALDRMNNESLPTGYFIIRQ